MSSIISYYTSLFVLAELLCNDSENLEKKMFSTLSDPVEVKYANGLGRKQAAKAWYWTSPLDIKYASPF